jgi:hypothetical protein
MMHSTDRPAARQVPPYTRADAIADGLLIPVPARLAQAFRFTFPMAVSSTAWKDTVTWDAQSEAAKPRRTGLTEAERLTDLLWAARTALSGNRTGSHDLEFVVHRVPPAGPDLRALRRTMVLHLMPGDHGETVATLGLQYVEPAGQFQRADDWWTWWPATDLDRRGDRTSPVVTADILDALLSHLMAENPRIDVTPGMDGTVDVHQNGIVVSLRPDETGRYHLAPLDWTWRYRPTRQDP